MEEKVEKTVVAFRVRSDVKERLEALAKLKEVGSLSELMRRVAEAAAQAQSDSAEVQVLLTELIAYGDALPEATKIVKEDRVGLEPVGDELERWAELKFRAEAAWRVESSNPYIEGRWRVSVDVEEWHKVLRDGIRRTETVSRSHIYIYRDTLNRVHTSGSILKQHVDLVRKILYK